MVSGNARAAGVTVASRTLALLAAFDDSHRSLTLSELAERADQSLPTSHRLVSELVAWGALQRRPDGRYVVGPRLWDIGLLAPAPTGLREVAAPFLHDMYAATLATVHLAERDGREALYLDRISGRATVPVVSRIGGRLPLYATAVGKVLLAYAPDDVRRGVLSDLRRVTPFTVIQPAQLVQQLRRVLIDGHASTTDEMSLGASSVAVPIRAGSGPVIAALGVVVPSLKRDRTRLVAALHVAAGGIGRTLADRADKDP